MRTVGFLSVIYDCRNDICDVKKSVSFTARPYDGKTKVADWVDVINTREQSPR